MSKRITRDVRIDVETDEYIRSVSIDTFRNRIRHGAYSDIINHALTAWVQEHKKLTALTVQEPSDGSD
jgi:hypothetical protein